jgi:N utilization substance protein B
MSGDAQEQQAISKLAKSLEPEDLRAARRFSVQFAYAFDLGQGAHFSERDFGAFADQVEISDKVLPFVRELCRLMAENLAQLDGHIEACSHNWILSRIAKVDLAIVRICTVELLFRSDVAFEIILADSAEIGKEIGSQNSSSFVNGLLDGIAKRIRASGGQQA